jgi:restriction endonuclease Mrr
MAIPDYQTIMLPLLRVVEDGGERTKSDAFEQLSSKFGLTQTDKDELLPSGQQRTFDNRIGCLEQRIVRINMRKKHSGYVGHTFTCVVCHKKCLCGIKKKDHVGRHRAHPWLSDHRWGLHFGRKRHKTK